MAALPSAALPWIDLPHGVRVQVRPLDRALSAAVRAFAARGTRAFFGGAVGPNQAADRETQRTVYAGEYAAGLARFGVAAWEGVGGLDGLPLPHDPDAAERLGRTSLGAALIAAYEALPPIMETPQASPVVPAERQAASGQESPPWA